MNYEKAEDELLHRLQNFTGSPGVITMPANFSGYILPDSQSDYKKNIPQGNEVKIGIICRGAHFEVSENTDHVAQVELMVFEMNVMALKRRGDNGIYAGLEWVRKRLLGYQSLNGYFKRLHFIDELLLNFEEGVWQYAFTMGGETTITQDDDDEIDYANITRITAGNAIVPDNTL